MSYQLLMRQFELITILIIIVDSRLEYLSEFISDIN